MHSIIIFASGAGSNTAAIIDYFKKEKKVKVALIVTNNANAGVIGIAEREEIPFLVIDKRTFHEMLLLEQLTDYHPSLIVLAGFLWKIPVGLLDRFPGKIINIHPALLPLYGGKGMYGANVHNAVIKSGDKESGITIHFVNDQYDKGAVILQARCPVGSKESGDQLAAKIHQLEHFYLPRTIEYLLENM